MAKYTLKSDANIPKKIFEAIQLEEELIHPAGKAGEYLVVEMEKGDCDFIVKEADFDSLYEPYTEG